jgi:hypothetical protein
MSVTHILLKNPEADGEDNHIEVVRVGGQQNCAPGDDQ